jgi:hypothetical protein
VDSSLIGAAVYAILLGFGGLALLAILREVTRSRTQAQHVAFRPAPSQPPTPRPCAVYEIDTVLPNGKPGRYIGYGYNPHQRIMSSHRRAKWWLRAVTAQATLEPDRVDWYEDEHVAHAEEIRRIRQADPSTLENKILYREGAA